ncbi:TrgA family protein [Sagittula salina]|uniref:TrgA family protein n=1 Tax=Sagittula salina TaxID=2820268 RepID=A0A940MLA1_9RHOB|nr:TrgA family protein [Sagittula salina]MBP0481845.1 TrgA family protein [Sagittula salina]
MPTAARLIAALCLAVVGWLVSEAIRPLYPPNTNFGLFNYVNTALGFYTGWTILGRRAGRGMAAGISNGFTAALMLLLFGLLVQSVNEMLRLAFARHYKGGFEAVTDIFAIGLDFAVKIADGQVLITLFVGGILSGILAEIAARRWG